MLWTGADTIGLVAQFFGLGFAISGLRHMYRGLSTKQWPSVQGRVVRSEVTSGGGILYGREATSSSGLALYSPHVVYRYTVDRTVIEGSVLHYGGSLPTYGEAHAICAAHPVGASVTVYYDPSDHERAVLYPGVHDGNAIETFIGCLVFGVGTVVRILS